MFDGIHDEDMVRITMLNAFQPKCMYSTAGACEGERRCVTMCTKRKAACPTRTRNMVIFHSDGLVGPEVVAGQYSGSLEICSPPVSVREAATIDDAGLVVERGGRGRGMLGLTLTLTGE
jgi:hypothetical protein